MEPWKSVNQEHGKIGNWKFLDVLEETRVLHR